VLKLPYPLIVLGAALLGWGAGRWKPQWVQKPKATHGRARPPKTVAGYPPSTTTTPPPHPTPAPRAGAWQ